MVEAIVAVSPSRPGFDKLLKVLSGTLFTTPFMPLW